MDIKHLRYFVGIAEAGSLMKAAERLAIAQPALSVHLANLEDDLDVRLVERTNRGVTLTDAGLAFYERAVALLQHYSDSILEFRNHCGAPSGTVSLGVPSTLPALLVPRLYQAMQADYPEITLYLLDASSAAIYEWLQAGKIDFAILINFPENVGFQLTPLFVDDYCLVGPATGGSGAGGPDEISFAEVFDHELAVPSWSTAWRKVIEDQAEACGKRVKVRLETESCTAMKALALSGQCQVLLPRSAVEAETAAGLLRARRIVAPDLTGLFSLGRLNNKLMTPAMTAFHDLVVRTLGCELPETIGREQERLPTAVPRVCPSSLFARPRPIPRGVRPA